MEIGISEPHDISHGPIRAHGTGAIQTGETVTWNLSASTTNATQVANGTGSMADDGVGNYAGTIPASATSGLTEATTYYIFILCSGKVARRIPVTARYRGAT